MIQDERKAVGLDVSDRIDLRLGVPAERLADVQAHQEMIATETLALSVELTSVTGDVSVSVTKR